MYFLIVGGFLIDFSKEFDTNICVRLEIEQMICQPDFKWQLVPVSFSEIHTSSDNCICTSEFIALIPSESMT